MKYTELIKSAITVKERSYSPYSKFRVGAALLTKDGKIVTGCNVENSSYSLTICAERTAIVKAISEGYKNFKAIAIVSDLDDFLPPCGACRQMLFEFSKDLDVVLFNGKKSKIIKMKDLLPFPFDDNFLDK